MLSAKWSIVNKSKKHCLVLNRVYISVFRCGHCQALTPEWKKAATALQGLVKVGAVNADEHQSLGGQYGVRGFPTIKVFGLDKKKPTDYQGMSAFIYLFEVFPLTHSLIHHFESIPNLKRLQATTEMWVFKDFKIQIAEKTLGKKVKLLIFLKLFPSMSIYGGKGCL